MQEFKPLLAIKCNNNIDRWPSVLGKVRSSINSNISNTTNKSAYQILYGYEPNTPVENEYSNYDVKVAERFKEVLEDTIISKKVQEDNYNNRLATKSKFAVGDEVYVRKMIRESAVDVKNISAVVESVRGPDSYVVRSPEKGLQNINAKDLMLRSAKEFRNNNDKLVGSRVSVWWPDSQQHFSGQVMESNDKRKGTHIVRYDDGEEVYERLVNQGSKKAVEFELERNDKRISAAGEVNSNTQIYDEDYNSSLDEDYVESETVSSESIDDSSGSL